MTDSRREHLRKLCEQRLLAVTFIPGGQGSFFTRLLNHSGGIAQFTRASIDQRLEGRATAHVNNEQWLSHCHHWDQAKLLNDDYFFNNLSNKILDELEQGQGLIPFRTHPEVSMSIQKILPKIQILYIYDNDYYRPYRLYYEKLIKPLGNQWYIEDFYRATGKPPSYLTDDIRSNLLNRWFEHTQLTKENFPNAYHLCVNEFFADPWNQYIKLTNQYKLTPMDQSVFDSIHDPYILEQSISIDPVFDKAVETHKNSK